MNAALFISRRLSLKRGTGLERNSPAVTIATVGIALSVIIMTLTLAIVPGFKNQITQKVMGFDAQLTVLPVEPLTLEHATSYPVRLTDTLRSRIATQFPEANISLNIKLPGILKTDDHFNGVVFEAYSDPVPLDFVAGNLVDGYIPDYANDSSRYDIIISKYTARALDLTVGARIDGYFFTNDNLRARKFNVAGIYDSHFNDFDRLIAYMSYSTASTLSEMNIGEGTSIQLRGLDNERIPDANKLLTKTLSSAFHDGITSEFLQVTDVYRENPMYFNWLDLLDTNVTVIIWLMSAVAAITLISCVFIMILERVRLIGILKSIGATNGLLRQIFLYTAERVVIRGILIGDLIALLLITLQFNFHLIPLDPESYYLSYVPVEYNWLGFIVLNIATAATALVVMLIPVMSISRISPVRVLRFE